MGIGSDGFGRCVKRPLLADTWTTASGRQRTDGVPMYVAQVSPLYGDETRMLKVSL